MINFEFKKVSSLEGAIEALTQNPSGILIAGGTNLIDLMKKGVISETPIIDITKLPLKHIKENDTGLEIGSLVLNSEVIKNDIVKKYYPLLAMALKAGASEQLRNMATVGGNVMQKTRCTYFNDTAMPCNKREKGSGCGAIKGYNRMHAILGASDKCISAHPSDMCVALAALNGSVMLIGPKGKREMLITNFLRLPGNKPEKDHNLLKGELITGIKIPRNSFNKNVYYLKIRDRTSYAFALVSVAVALELKDNIIKHVRLALGGVAQKPWRLTEAEEYLTGKSASIETFTKGSKLALKDAKAYKYNKFKLKLVPAAIIEALIKSSGISFP